MVETETKKKLITISVVIILVIAGIYTFNYLVKETFFALHPEALDEYTTSFTVSKDLALNKEFTIIWKSEYKYLDKLKKADHTQLRQLMLPESIILIDGELRDIKNIGDDIYYTWTLKPIETGTHYIKFGYCDYVNESLVQNESLDYNEVSGGLGQYYSLYFLCLDVKENSGEILAPNNVVVTNYTVSGNIDYSLDDSIYPVYSFKKGSICWINITVDSAIDIPNCDMFLTARGYSSPFEYITPRTFHTNLTKGMNYFNYTIFIYNLTGEYQNEDVTVNYYIDSNLAWPVRIHPDEGFYPAKHNTHVAFVLRFVD